MDDNDRYLLDINKDNLTRVIGFASAYESQLCVDHHPGSRRLFNSGASVLH